MALLCLSVDLPSPELVWGLFQRALGVAYFWAIIQLYPQVLPLAGSRGVQPVVRKLAQIRDGYPGWRHWLYFPTLLWLNATDRFLKGWLLVGAGAALVVVYGGPLAGGALLVCWAVYLSFDLAVGLTYPWDSVLFEAGFLGLFLPQLPTLPELAVTTLPVPAVAWAYRWLFFRLLFGFGKFKFIGGSLHDTGYFKSFLVNIPLPTYLGWYAYRLPRWVFQGIILLVFTSEVVLPFGVFFAGDTRVVVACMTALLMVGIQLVSNFGFFNVLTIVLCLPLLDRNASLFDTTAAMLQEHPVTHVVVAGLALGGLLNLPFNSWCTLTWLHWPSLLRIRLPGVQPLLAFYRALLRFRLVHSYGVFPPTSSPPIRWVPVIEGSRDGVTWLPYEYWYMTTTETTPPRFVAPHHPRFDHAIFYESYGTNDTNFVWSTMGNCNPYDFTHASGLECILQRLLEGEPSTLKLFRHSPFPADAPPTTVRVTLYRFQPVSPAEQRRTGRWWTRTQAGTHLPPVWLDGSVWEQRSTQPELFHPDAIHWRRRSPQTRAWHELAKAGATDQFWPAIEAGMTTDLDEFWNGFMVLIQQSGLAWPMLPEAVARFRSQYDRQQRGDLERILNRLSLALLAKLEPHFIGKAEPQLPVSEYFQLALLTHHLIAKGRTIYTAVLQNPAEAAAHLTDFRPEQSFYYLGLFWFDTLVYQARKFRLSMQISVLQSGNGLPGFLELVPFVSQQFTDIGYENLPTMRRNPVNGEWLIAEKEPADALPDDVTSRLEHQP